MDGAWGLIDLDWSQHMPIFHPDDIDRDPQFTQYPFQEGDDLDDDDEEEMEVESQLLGGAGDASMVPPSNTQHIYNAYQRHTLSSPLKLRACPGAHILTLTPPWRWEVLVWLLEAQTCVT